MNKNPKGYWFKRRRYGWGWTPVSWQGWTSMLVAFGAVAIASFVLPAKPVQPTMQQLNIFFGVLVAAVLFLLITALLKSPRPHWRWGVRPDDNPDEDF